MHQPIQISDKNGTFLSVVESPRAAVLSGSIRLISRVILTDKKGRILLQKRDPNMVAWPGRWDSSAAGHVDEGETPEQAACRELYEEIGLDNIVLKPSRQYYHEKPIENGYFNRTYNHVYKADYNGDLRNLKLQKGEVVEVKWFTLEEVKILITNQPESVTDGLARLFGESE